MRIRICTLLPFINFTNAKYKVTLSYLPFLNPSVVRFSPFKLADHHSLNTLDFNNTYTGVHHIQIQRLQKTLHTNFY